MALCFPKGQLFPFNLTFKGMIHIHFLQCFVSFTYSWQFSQIVNFFSEISVASKAPIKIGTLLSFSDGGINIEFNNCASCPCAPERHDYLMFAKSKSVNTSGLKGYYLKAVFKNNSTKYAELFSVGTEVTESSK